MDQENIPDQSIILFSPFPSSVCSGLSPSPSNKTGKHHLLEHQSSVKKCKSSEQVTDSCSDGVRKRERRSPNSHRPHGTPRGSHGQGHQAARAAAGPGDSPGSQEGRRQDIAVGMKALLGIRQGQGGTPLGEPGLHPSPQAAPGGTQAEPEGQGCGRTPHTEPPLGEENSAGRIMSGVHSGEEKWGAVRL